MRPTQNVCRDAGVMSHKTGEAADTVDVSSEGSLGSTGKWTAARQVRMPSGG